MPGNEDCFPHVRIHPRCGACGYYFHVNDRIIAVVGSSDSTFSTAHDAYEFQGSRYCQQGSEYNWIFCRFPNCSRCALSEESATVHIDCFNLFVRESTASDKIHRLWEADIWRHPWKGAVPLNLPHDVDISNGIRWAANVCNLPKLQSLPAELTQMIWNYSHPSTLWRYSSVIDLVHTLSTPTNSEFISIPLHEVYSWHRGGSLVVRKSDSNPIVRLTIDSQGLRQIERLLVRPVAGRRSDTTVYVVETVECFAGVYAQFKFGLGRLRIPPGSKGFQIWDTPTPPTLEQCLPYPTILPPFPRFATIETRNCTGLTFFISDCSTFAIHAHTRARPYAQATFERLPPPYQRCAAWLYIPTRDGITEFGLRLPLSNTGIRIPSRPSFLLRTNLSEGIAIGHYEDGRTEDIKLSTGSRFTLIHNIPEIGSISIFGAYPRNLGNMHITCTSFSDDPFGDASFSSASLDNVAGIQIFNDKGTGLCKGIIIEYNNGLERALGQCRIGVDSLQRLAQPSHICLAHVMYYRLNTEVKLSGVKVESTTRAIHEHNGIGWKCHVVRGILEFWFTGEEARLEIFEID